MKSKKMPRAILLAILGGFVVIAVVIAFVRSSNSRMADEVILKGVGTFDPATRIVFVSQAQLTFKLPAGWAADSKESDDAQHTHLGIYRIDRISKDYWEPKGCNVLFTAPTEKTMDDFIKKNANYYNADGSVAGPSPVESISLPIAKAARWRWGVEGPVELETIGFLRNGVSVRLTKLMDADMTSEDRVVLKEINQVCDSILQSMSVIE